MKEENQINCPFQSLPFKRSLSFEYLISELEVIGNDKNHPLRTFAAHVLGELEMVPAFRETIKDYSILDSHNSLVQQLFAFVINPMNSSEYMAGIAAPFSSGTLYTTEKFDKNLDWENSRIELAKEVDVSMDTMMISMIYHAYMVILEKIYDFPIDIDMPFTFRLTNEKNGRIRFLKKKFNTKYLRVKSKETRKKISKEDLKQLFDNAEDLDAWNEKIPLADFEFQGFVYFHYEDVTFDHVISQLKSDLLNKDSITTKQGFEKIKKKVRALTENADLEFGMAVAPEKDTDLSNNFVWNTIVPRSELRCDDYMGTFYEEAFRKRKMVLTEDLSLLNQDKVVQSFVQRQFKSHVVIPLFVDKVPVGMLEFASKKDDLNMIQIKRMHELFPIFSVALQRSREEWNDKVQSLIQEEFTAIHPTVEWRFKDAANQLLRSRSNNEPVLADDIVFNEVVPIYGASDIRSSSIERNLAIQADLTEQLQHAFDILNQAGKIKEMPLLNDLRFKIDTHLRTVKSGLKAGDEVVILEFLKRDIDPVFSLLRDRYTAFKPIVEDYFLSLDPDLHVLYKKRKDFEDSLTLINDHVSEIIDREQEKAQDVFPHYFEKYRTDGVEYNAYIGQSLVRDLKYSEIYLKNIRLWQLLVKVQVARKIKSLQPNLATKLDITQLILVHSNPLSIAFRQDEKKFDVAGAYNIRYEITKKRIDKALINGTDERVTQVGKIAIIYSHAEEIREYQRYIDYMISQKYLTSSIEHLELEDLKGASGLRALRVEVDFSNLDANEIDFSDIDKAIKGA